MCLATLKTESIINNPPSTSLCKAPPQSYNLCNNPLLSHTPAPARGRLSLAERAANEPPASAFRGMAIQMVWLSVHEWP